MEGLEGLPTWVQVLASATVFLFVTGTAVFGYVNKHLIAKMEQDQPKDGMVLSATIADGRAVRDLTFALNSHIAVLDNHADTMRNSQDTARSQTEATRELIVSVKRLTALIESHLSE